MVSHFLIQVEVSGSVREIPKEISVSFLRAVYVFWFKDAGHKKNFIEKGLLQSDL